VEHEVMRNNPELETLSMEELQALLVEDFSAEDEETSDPEFITAIMEVMEQKGYAAPQSPDPKAAWKDFKEIYLGETASAHGTNFRETDSSNHVSLPPVSTPKNRKRISRYLLAAAVLVVLLGTAASALRFTDLMQAIAAWTAETFSFAAQNGEEGKTPVLSDPFESLRDNVARYTDLKVIPNRGPVGSEEDPDVKLQITGRTGATRILATYITHRGQFTFRVQIYDILPNEYVGIYQKDEGVEVIPYEAGGLTHHLMPNLEKNAASWTRGNVECTVQGNLTLEELEDMIDSIYEEP